MDGYVEGKLVDLTRFTDGGVEIGLADRDEGDFVHGLSLSAEQWAELVELAGKLAAHKCCDCGGTKNLVSLRRNDNVTIRCEACIRKQRTGEVSTALECEYCGGSCTFDGERWRCTRLCAGSVALAQRLSR